ncbi:MAG: biotin/lipoyl-binding protein [Selenomonadaceae bacterium]|nr:biotin/lipoyl-binding protein [Selenomonadaceae bacterium]
MAPRRKAIRAGIFFIALLIISGVVLMYRGNDAVFLATQKKDGILTAEQIKLSFDSVGGRLINEAVREGQEVKAGQVVMELDATDTDLSIEKLKAQIAQLDAQINSTSGNMRTTLFKVTNDEQQSFRQIDSQRGAVASAQATLSNAELDYKRKEELFKAGAIAKAQLDDAIMILNVARANVDTQQQLLDRLLAGVADNGATDSLNLPTIAQERASAENIRHDIAALTQQKKFLEVQLKELEVAKSRLTLHAPEDGKILSILQKQGEMISPNVPVILLETRRIYYDIYLSEEQAVNLREGDEIICKTVAGDKAVRGTIRLLTQAPGFADLRQSREKGQADLSAFQVRIYIDEPEKILAGQTVTVEFN